ncbi:MAG TPA: superoxide dismutase [Bacteroidales bacterium]|nr:superoxide dismutase [Bacteroidales bacterium]
MDKRTFLRTSVAGLGGIFAMSSFAPGRFARKILKQDAVHEFTLPELPYTYDALEPYIDSETMNIHHSRHHAGYTDKFNAAVKEAGITGKNAKEILSEVSQYPDTIRNNGGGYFNHKLFWRVLSPNGGVKPEEELLTAINGTFSSFENFKNEFSQAAITLFGSGWAWLILSEGKLKVTTTRNQDSPVMDIAEVKGTPLLMIDVWEHAYYLKYQNRRAEYVDAFWNIVNWEFVSKKYSRILQG